MNGMVRISQLKSQEKYNGLIYFMSNMFPFWDFAINKPENHESQEPRLILHQAVPPFLLCWGHIPPSPSRRWVVAQGKASAQKHVERLYRVVKKKETHFWRPF